MDRVPGKEHCVTEEGETVGGSAQDLKILLAEIQAGLSAPNRHSCTAYTGTLPHTHGALCAAYLIASRPLGWKRCLAKDVTSPPHVDRKKHLQHLLTSAERRNRAKILKFRYYIPYEDVIFPSSELCFSFLCEQKIANGNNMIAGSLATSHKCKRIAKNQNRNNVMGGGSTAYFMTIRNALWVVKHPLLGCHNFKLLLNNRLWVEDYLYWSYYVIFII